MRYETNASAEALRAETHSYDDFLKAKVAIAPNLGFEVPNESLHPWLKPHAAALASWALRKGRAALFASFGLHKTSIQLEVARIIAGTEKRFLIVAPLGVRQEFRNDAVKLDIPVTFIRRTDEVTGPGVYVTNYESARESKIDVSLFEGVSLDEAAVLRGFGGTKTFREFMGLFEGTRYRFVATATPSPNEYIELLAYAAFLGVMDVGQAKTRFFKRDSVNADKLTLHPHKEREFWFWVSSWAIFLLQPSDLGFDDAGYVMPPVEVEWHEVPSDHSQAGQDREGQGRMFRNAAIGVSEAAGEKRASMDRRIEKMMEIIDARSSRSQEGICESLLSSEQRSHDLRSETTGCKTYGRNQRIPSQIQDGEQRGIVGGATGTREDCLQEGYPGVCEAGSEITPEILRDNTRGIRADANSTERYVRDLRRNFGAEITESSLACGPLPPNGGGEGSSLSSVQCGFGDVQRQSGYGEESFRLPDQFIIWCDLNDEQRAIERALESRGISYSSIHGGLSLDEAESQMSLWKDKQTTAMIAKPIMLGAGVNLQQCNKAVFLGVNHKFYAFIQAVHRIQRFGQTKTVHLDIIHTEAERDVKRSLELKWRRHNELVAKMRDIVKEYGLAEGAYAKALTRSMGVERQERAGYGWKMALNDSVIECALAPESSVHLIVTSIPFATQYEYSPSFNDFGHTDDNDHFWRQMDYLTPGLLRMLSPGRDMVIHVKDRIVPGGVSGLGFQTLHPFHAEAIYHYQRHGFAFLGMKTVTTDVVRENNQTYRLGWTEQCKDGSRMGCGVPEYLLLFRKPPSDMSSGYADIPVVKDKPLCIDNEGVVRPFDKKDNWKRPVPGTGYSRSSWQLDAHGYSRSSGDRLLSVAELANMPHEAMYKWWEARSLTGLYDYQEHKTMCEILDELGRLPATFMLFQPHSVHPDVWTDVARMRTLNAEQERKGQEMHLCPMQYDIADRAIIQLSMPGETVFDPFAGIGTVPLRAMKFGRVGYGSELSPLYWRDAVKYCEAEERKLATPSLFDILGAAN
jgi:DNA methylase/Helicase conserved C-terminal domain